MPDHFVVHTQPNCEQRAIDRLKSQSFQVYCPLTLVRRHHARRIDYVPRPFLPRYLFVLDDGRGVSNIKRTHGVHDVVRAGLEPIRARQSVVDALKAREINGYVDLKDTTTPSAFRKGELVRVTDGLWDSYQGLFQQMRGETRALVFLTLLRDGGGVLPVQVEARHLERAA